MTDLSPIAAKADDLEAIKKAVDDAAAVGGGLWLSYLFVLFYLAVAAGAVTHADLFFEKPVKLPFLGIDLPLFAFFALAPILFIIVHAYTLVHLVMLTEKTKRFHEAVHDAERNVDLARRENLQWQLPSNIFIQFLAGPEKIRRGLFGSALRAIAWITLVIAPILLLLLMQVQFLPYHSSIIVSAQRVALVADLVLIWWLWRRILSGRETDRRRRLGARLWAPLGFALGLAVLFFSVTVVTFPGEWQERLPSWRTLPAMTEWGNPATDRDAKGNPRTASIRDWLLNAEKLSLHDWLFDEKLDSVSRRRFPFSNTLVVTGLNIYEGLGIDDPEKAKRHDFVFRARGRELRRAIFDLAILPKVDFEGAQLQGASLSGAQLQGASLVGARLQGAGLDDAQLQGASLQAALLEATDLSRAFLWRTNSARPPNHPEPMAVRFSEPPDWRPSWIDTGGKLHPWDDEAYQGLLKTIEAPPPGRQSERALENIRRLDCANPDKRLASCDPSASPPFEAATWREALESASVDKTYAEALAKVLKALVCSGGDEAVYVVRGAGFRSRLRDAGAAASELMGDLADKNSRDCPVSALLTDADRKLLQIKRMMKGAPKQSAAGPALSP